jgi:hypothetical protein
MKKLLLALSLGFSLSLSAQEELKTSFQTSTIESSVMTYNQNSEKWEFEDANNLQEYNAFWTFRLGKDGKGGYIASGDIIYSVFDWQYTETGVLVNFFSHQRKEDGTLIVVVRDDGRNTMSFFLPESNFNITFHQSTK